MSYPQNPSEPSGQPDGGGSYGGPPQGGYGQQGSYGQQGGGQTPSYGSQPPAYGGGSGQPPVYGGGSGQPPYGGGSGQPPYAPQGGDPSDRNFFAKLFDFSFSSYITPSIVKVVYILIMIAIVIGWLGISISAFTESAGLGLVMLLIVGPIVALLYLVLARITLEFYTAVIRISEDVSDLKHRQTVDR